MHYLLIRTYALYRKVLPYKTDVALWTFAVCVMVASFSFFTDKAQHIFQPTKTQKYLAEKTTLKSDKVPLSENGLKTYNASKVKSVQTHFKSVSYDLADVIKYRQAVPSIQPDSIPKDLGEIYDVRIRKKIFLSMMLPLALKINDDIAKQRLQLKSIIQSYQGTGKITATQQAFISQLVMEYGVRKTKNLEKTTNLEKTKNLEKKLNTLWLHVDTLPVSLILAQGAIESGWGSSRFAVNGNALFGQWTWEKGAGIIPLGRDEGKTHSIKKFSSPYNSMKAYVRNINRNSAYEKLRLLRGDLRNLNKAVSGNALAETLNKYSQEREEYVRKLQVIIKSNNLEIFNTLLLEK